MSMLTTVSVQLPEKTFRRLQRAAEITHRSVEEILASTVEATLPAYPQVPEPLASALAAMDMFNDDALWAADESSLSRAQQRRLNQLSHAGGQRTLTTAEAFELTQLIDLRDQAVLRRARTVFVSLSGICCADAVHHREDFARWQRGFLSGWSAKCVNAPTVVANTARRQNGLAASPIKSITSCHAPEVVDQHSTICVWHVRLAMASNWIKLKASILNQANRSGCLIHDNKSGMEILPGMKTKPRSTG